MRIQSLIGEVVTTPAGECGSPGYPFARGGMEGVPVTATRPGVPAAMATHPLTGRSRGLHPTVDLGMRITMESPHVKTLRPDDGRGRVSGEKHGRSQVTLQRPGGSAEAAEGCLRQCTLCLSRFIKGESLGAHSLEFGYPFTSGILYYRVDSIRGGRAGSSAEVVIQDTGPNV